MIISIYCFIIYFSLIGTFYYLNNKFTRAVVKYILSDIPIFQISHDENFHTIENDFDLSKCYRFSLLFIPFGKYKLYFLTYKKSKGFQVLYILSIDNIYNKMRNKAKVNIVNQYAEINKKCETIEILKEDIALYKESMNTAKTKATIYMTLLAAILSIVFTQLKALNGIYSQMEQNIYFLFIFYYLVLMLLNFFILNIQFVSVKSIYREIYDDFKSNSFDKYLHYLKNMYWIKLDSQLLVTYIKAIEIYLIKIMIIFSMLSAVYIII